MDLPQIFNLIVAIALFLLMIASIWRIYEKAGEKGWKAIVPVYNIIVMLRIVGKPAWWLILLFIPVINIIFAFLLSYALMKSFGKGILVALGYFFFPFIVAPIIAFGDSVYVGPLMIQTNKTLPDMVNDGINKDGQQDKFKQGGA